MQKKYYLTDVAEETVVSVSCGVGNNMVEFEGTVTKVYDGFICLDIPKVDGKVLSFNGVKTSILANVGEENLLKFPECNIVYLKGYYVAKCFKEGSKVNRRKSFRVGVSVLGSMHRLGVDPVNVYVRDISATGFSITTDKALNVGDEICVRYSDLGYKLILNGKIVRMVEENGKFIYGLQQTKETAGLSTYIASKQRDILRKQRG